MSFVLVLSTALATPVLADASIAAAAAAADLSPSSARWLFPGIAAELPTETPVDLTSLRAALGPAPIDANLVETADRRKRLLVADLESTLIENEMLDDLAERLGIGPKIAAITQRSMRGEVDFTASLRERVALLTGAPVALLAECAARIRPMPGAKSLIATMAAKGARCVIATGGFGYFAHPIAAELGCHAVYCNHLEVSADETRLTGRLRGAIFDRAAKRRALETEADRLALPRSASLAVGDGANDLDMLSAAGFGVAFRAKPVVAASASLVLTHSDLAGLLFLQGYRADEILRG